MDDKKGDGRDTGVDVLAMMCLAGILWWLATKVWTVVLHFWPWLA
jgi:hypothetical protein